MEREQGNIAKQVEPLFAKIVVSLDKQIMTSNDLIEKINMKLDILKLTGIELPSLIGSEKQENSLYGCLERMTNNLDITNEKLMILNNKLNDLL